MKHFGSSYPDELWEYICEEYDTNDNIVSFECHAQLSCFKWMEDDTVHKYLACFDDIDNDFHLANIDLDDLT